MSVRYIRVPIGMTDLLILFGSDRQVRRTVRRLGREGGGARTR